MARKEKRKPEDDSDDLLPEHKEIRDQIRESWTESQRLSRERGWTVNDMIDQFRMLTRKAERDRSKINKLNKKRYHDNKENNNND
jgi:hypothetical protein